ncbi:MAG: hypothetical protein L0G27_02055 [Paracoccus sp. (in: a-proteobacteria)]|nr:hypothetical protein [Paracoccus sp. (in: a-proteobacteria)]
MSKLPVLQLVRRLPVFLRLPATKMLHRRYGCDLTLSPEDFRGCRVLILGPARTLADDLTSLDPSDFDVLVKMNNGLDTPVPLPSGNAMHCDVLLHSATCEARPITADKLRQAGVKVLVHRTPTKSSFLQTMLLQARFGKLLRVRHIAWQAYRDLSTALDGASPTTGLVGTCFFLHAPVSEVAIAGFTFFSTAYQPGYDDCVSSDSEAVGRIAAKGHHAPSKEAALLSREIETARSKGVTVTLAPHVVTAMQRCAAVPSG